VPELGPATNDGLRDLFESQASRLGPLVEQGECFLTRAIGLSDHHPLSLGDVRVLGRRAIVHASSVPIAGTVQACAK